MISSSLNFCRLCTSSESLTNIHKRDDNINLYSKISSCVDIKIYPGDGLTSLICMQCETNINNFYDFKQQCKEIDFRLKTAMQISPTKLGDTRYSNNIDIKNELLSDFNEGCRKSLDSWNKDIVNDNYVEGSNIVEIQSEPEETSESNLNKYKNNKIQNVIKNPLHKMGLKLNNAKPNDTFQCEICGCMLKHKAVLKKHLMSHSGIKQFSCKVCPKQFTRAEHKIVHMRSHMGLKPYICEICGKASRKRQDLIRHMRVHSEERKYVCPHCDRRFKRSGDVNSHLRTHTGARPYTCSICVKSYTSHSGLSKHYKSHCKKEPSDRK